MIHYFLEGWKKELDTKFASEWQSLVDKKTPYHRNQVERTLHYQMVDFLYKKIETRDMLESFRPFAVPYIEKLIKGKCDAFEIYVHGDVIK